jgi:glycosyltransferase involved in cell wall biosynthesis
MKVLVYVDRPNWAYDSIAKNLIRYSSSEVKYSFRYLKGKRVFPQLRQMTHDLIFFMGFQSLFFVDNGVWKSRYPFLNLNTVATGIHSHHSWDEKKSTPAFSPVPPASLVECLAKCLKVNTVSLRLFKIFTDAGLDNLAYTPNGVDPNIFKPSSNRRQRGPLRVGFSGNDLHDWRKGVSDIITPASRAIPGVELCLALPNSKNYCSVDEMPAFYQGLDVYICASLSEGFSLSVLEAASCGLPIISTRVGGCEDLIESGINGFLVNRNVEEFRDKILYLSQNEQLRATIGRRIRDTVLRDYSWSNQVLSWEKFLKADL